MNCVDFGKQYIETKTQERKWSLNESRAREFYNLCHVVDNIIEEFEVETTSLDITENKEVEMEIQLGYISIDTMFHKFYALVRKANSCRFFESNGNLICVFIYDGIWEASSEQ